MNSTGISMNNEHTPSIRPAAAAAAAAGMHKIPTDDSEVRQELRRLGEPITYFGEDDVARRDRLVKLLREQGEDGGQAVNSDSLALNAEGEAMDEDTEGSDDEEFYTPGTEKLLQARKSILHYSLDQAATRLQKQKGASQKQNMVKNLKHRRHINRKLAEFELYGTQVLKGNTRTLSTVAFSPDSSVLASGSWDGSIHFLNRVDLSQMGVLQPGNHTEKIGAIDWNPQQQTVLISGGNEGNINIWNVATKDDKQGVINPQKKIKQAHQNSRVTSTLFHPTGEYFVSTSFDQTWKLWNVEKTEDVAAALLTQEGHSKEVFCASFHPDGGLIATGGFDAVGLLWDLRSGRKISSLEGHIKGIYSMDWSPNGHHLATASGDSCVKIWDLRMLNRSNSTGELASIPAHHKLVSKVKFFSQNHDKNNKEVLAHPVTDEDDKNPETLSSNGTFLVSSSYDGIVNIWSSDNWIRVKSLEGHNEKIMSCDITNDGTTIASCGWDRSVKLWCL